MNFSEANLITAKFYILIHSHPSVLARCAGCMCDQTSKQVNERLNTRAQYELNTPRFIDVSSGNVPMHGC